MFDVLTQCGTQFFHSVWELGVVGGYRLGTQVSDTVFQVMGGHPSGSYRAPVVFYTVFNVCEWHTGSSLKCEQKAKGRGPLGRSASCPV